MVTKKLVAHLEANAKRLTRELWSDGKLKKFQPLIHKTI